MSTPSTGSYPGNPSLPVEVREKILMTFRHALGLFSSGHVSDCLIGCEFILKMDPRFTPARRLQEKARNRDSDVDISELQAFAAGQAPAPAAPAPATPPPARPAAAPPPPPPPAPARPEKPDTDRLLAEAGLKLAQRDFNAAIALASRVLSQKPADPEALSIVEKAAGKKATLAIVESSRTAADRALSEGRLSDARLELERVRALDADHPAVATLENRLASAASGAAAAAPTTDFSLDQEDTAELPLPGPGGSSLAAPSDSTDEPGLLEAVASHPASFTEIGDPDHQGGGSFSMESPSPGEEFLVPPSPPSPDIVLAPDASAPPVDFLTPAGGDEEAQDAEREIARLLRQGDEVSKKGDRQQAIEIWSRVFLIDINNAEAVTRIEKARQEMAEEGRLVGDLLKKGRESFEAGDREAARQIFLQAQALDPDEATARFYLERIEKEGAEPAPAPGPSPKTAFPTASEEELPKPSALSASAVPADRKPALRIQPRVLAVVGAFLVLTLIGIYFVFKGGGRAQEPPAKVVSSGSLQRARELLDKGKTDDARAELRRIGATDPDFEEARKMLADIGKGGAAASPDKGVSAIEPAAGSSRDARTEADPARLRVAAEKALSEKRYIEALKNFNLAASSFRDDPTFAQEQAAASEKVTALTPAVKFYNEGEYETAIPILWRILQEDRENQDARSYLLRAYYNQGITQLQNGLYPKAAQAFQEALALDPNDSEAARHRKFAERYQKGDLDLMGRIYVRHLNRRP